MKDVIETLFGLKELALISTEYVDDEDIPYCLYKFRHTGEVPAECPACHHKLYAHGNRSITLVDTPFGGRPAKLEIVYPRGRCKECKAIWQPTFDFVDAKHNMTKRAYDTIAQQALKNTFASVAEDFALTGTTITRTFEDYINEKKEQLRFATPAFLGIDEIKIKRVGEVTVITDLEHRTLYDMFLGRSQETLIKYFEKMPDRDKILWVCSDMYRPFQKAIGMTLPNARWVIDHFHVVMKANEAVDYVRKELQRTMTKKNRIKTKRGLAYTLKRRAKDLDVDEAMKIRLLRQTPEWAPLAIAFDLKEDFFNIYDDNMASKDRAIDAYHAWCDKIPADPLYEKFRELARTVVNFKPQIFAFWDCPFAISNGYTECMNRLIRENNTRGRGYSFEVLRARTLYRKANLQAIINSGMAYGPTLNENAPIFHFDSTDEDEDDWEDESDDFEPFPDPDDLSDELEEEN